MHDIAIATRRRAFVRWRERRRGERRGWMRVDPAKSVALKPRDTTLLATGMANHKSAEKRIRQTEKRTAINRSRLSRVRTFVKKVETAIASGDRAAAETAFQLAQPELHRAITKGVMHRNTVSRKLSRLAVRITAL